MLMRGRSGQSDQPQRRLAGQNNKRSNILDLHAMQHVSNAFDLAATLRVTIIQTYAFVEASGKQRNQLVCGARRERGLVRSCADLLGGIQMILASGLRASQRAFALLALSVLPACGGGVGDVVAIVSIVTPLGGAWNVDGNESLTFTGPSFGEVFASKFDVTATVRSQTNVCGSMNGSSVDVVGTLDNGDLVLRPVGEPPSANCLTGHFTDLVTLEATPTGQPKRLFYLNGAVFVRMQLGVWTSVGSGELKLMFDGPDSVANAPAIAVKVVGCDLSGSPVKLVSGEMTGFDPTTNAKPTIPELRDPNGVRFSQVVFVDGATLRLINSASQSVELHRTRDTADPPTKCPP
jgi:hypothetical protein